MFNAEQFKFNVNQVVVTRAAAEVLNGNQIYCSLQLHQLGKWGDICEEDRQANEDALFNQGRLMSVYKAGDDIVF